MKHARDQFFFPPSLSHAQKIRNNMKHARDQISFPPSLSPAQKIRNHNYEACQRSIFISSLPLSCTHNYWAAAHVTTNAYTNDMVKIFTMMVYA